jgi:hypothetical protein
MSSNAAMKWPQVSRTERFRGLWVALDNCRYDQITRQPTEGDVVDSDRDLADLCRRMRENGRSSCSVLFCSGDVFVEQAAPRPAAPSATAPASGRSPGAPGSR